MINLTRIISITSSIPSLLELNGKDHLVLLGVILDFWRANCVDVTVQYETDCIRSVIKQTNNEGL